eukprot:844408-Rhodomonas_salina.1
MGRRRCRDLFTGLPGIDGIGRPSSGFRATFGCVVFERHAEQTVYPHRRAAACALSDLSSS